MKRRSVSRRSSGLGRIMPSALTTVRASVSPMPRASGFVDPAPERTLAPSRRTTAGLSDVQNLDDAEAYTPTDGELRAMSMTRAEWTAASSRTRFDAARRAVSSGNDGDTADESDDSSAAHAWDALGAAADRGLQELGNYLDRESRERLAQIRADADRTLQSMRGASAAEVERIRAESQRAHDEAALEIARITAEANQRRAADEATNGGNASGANNANASTKANETPAWVYVAGGAVALGLIALAVKAMQPPPPPPLPQLPPYGGR